jgi:hypothetical protein
MGSDFPFQDIVVSVFSYLLGHMLLKMGCYQKLNQWQRQLQIVHSLLTLIACILALNISGIESSGE